MLSKSKFILAQQCSKSFWLSAKGIEPTNPPDAAVEDRLRAGNEVGEVSKELFPGGIDIEYISRDFQAMCDLTAKAIDAGATTIYEASFMEKGVFIRVDIMNKTLQGWDVYEVKSSSSLRSYHKEDASLQWYVLKNLNEIELNDAYVITLNNKYLKNGKINPIELFTKHLLTDYVESNLHEIEKQLEDIKLVSISNNEPEVSIGAQCKKPHSCDYLDRCWPKSTKENNSVFNLYKLNLDKKLDLYNQGITSFEQIKPDTKLSLTHQNQIKANEIKEPIINQTKIKDFINSVEYPISYFDFETFTDAVPLFDGQRPHMQMPFQYSLHIQKDVKSNIDSDKDHFEFIASIKEDPRRAIAESMLQNIPKSGSIMAYNQSFEKNCIKSLADHCPDISEDLLALNDRFIDLIDPFRSGGYYHHEFKGSFSIKKVLPAVCPNDKKLDYKNLDINNGLMASSTYKKMRSLSEDQRISMRKKLFAYCWLDTYAMYAIYIKLLEIVKT
tara:strand:+ start:2842 stop:4338 length:1497 start_codon:yes stop_codon:yes gene_type:complete